MKRLEAVGSAGQTECLQEASSIADSINDILQDEDFIRQKKLLMDELHNWSNYDEDSNVDYF